MRKLAQLDERERSAMVRRVEAALTDKIDRGPLAGVDGFRAVTPMDTLELRELVDAPRERLDIEYKA